MKTKFGLKMKCCRLFFFFQLTLSGKVGEKLGGMRPFGVSGVADVAFLSGAGDASLTAEFNRRRSASVRSLNFGVEGRVDERRNASEEGMESMQELKRMRY